MTKLEIAISRGDEEYDALTPAEEVAAKRGLIVVFPADNQLQIDIDSEEQYQEFERRIGGFEVDALHPCKITILPSASGLPKRHATITCDDRTFSTVERHMWQAALNDDPFRVYLNAVRYADGDEHPSRLFEKPVVDPDDDMDEPLGSACILGDTTCESCQ